MTRNYRSDDGSQQWLDEVAMNRIRGNRNQQPVQYQQPQRQQLIISEQQGRNQQQNYYSNPPANNNIQYRNVNGNTVRLMPGETEEDIKKARDYAEKTYMRIPHVVSPLYAPGAKFLKENGADASSLRNLSNTVTVNTDVDNLSNRIQSVIMNKYGAGDSQDALLAQMNPQMRMQVTQKLEQLQNGQWVAPNTLIPQMQNINQQNNGPQGCKVLPGYPAFHQIQYQGFGGTIPLVRAMGQIPPQMTGIDFVIKEVVRAYIVQPNENMINMSVIQSNQQNLIELVVLQAPPMTGVGVLLVPKEAVANGMGGRQVLTDTRQRVLNPQQQYMHQQQRPQMTVPNGYRNVQQPQQQMLHANYQRNTNGRGFLKG